MVIIKEVIELNKIKIVILTAVLVLVCAMPAVAADKVTVKIDGNAVYFPDQQPYINADNRTLVPVRAPMEQMGCLVTWNDATNQATITKNGNTAVFTIGSSNYTVNGQTKTMDTKAILQNNRTLFPIRFCAEAMGATVTWDAASYTVNITTTGSGRVYHSDALEWGYKDLTAKGYKVYMPTFTEGGTNAYGSIEIRIPRDTADETQAVQDVSAVAEKFAGKDVANWVAQGMNVFFNNSDAVGGKTKKVTEGWVAVQYDRGYQEIVISMDVVV